MSMQCEKVRSLLERFYDNELGKRKCQAVREHLRQCDRCSAEFEKLDRMGRMLRTRFEHAKAHDLSRLWPAVASEMERPAFEPEPAEPLRERLTRILSLPKPAWAAVAAVAVLVLAIFAALPGNRSSTMAANDCIIDKLEAEGSAVMVYETDESRMKIIWVMDQSADQPEDGEEMTL